MPSRSSDSAVIARGCAAPPQLSAGSTTTFAHERGALRTRGVLPITALSGDVEFLRLANADAFSARVHSVFDNVINLSTRERHLFTLATRGSDDAPNTLVLDLPTWRQLTVAIGSSVHSSKDGLVAPGLFEVALQMARPWEPRLPNIDHSTDVSAGGFTQMIDTLSAVVRLNGVRGGVLAPRRFRSGFEAAVSRHLTIGTHALVRALRLDDLEEASWLGRGLIGLGPGLTPAGDDFIAGLALVVASPGARAGRWQDFLTTLVNTHRDLTNDISFTTMIEATRGRARQPFVAVLDAVAAHDRCTLVRATRRSIAIGHSSGTDTLSGIQAGLHLEKALRGLS